MKEIIELIDSRYGYYLDDDMQKYLKAIRNKPNDWHLVIEKTVFKYMNNYARKIKEIPIVDYDNSNYLDAIRTNERGTSGQKYLKEDILKFLEDPDVKRKLEKQLEKKTTYVPFDDVRVPNVCISGYLNDYMLPPTEYEKVLMAGYTWFELVMLNAPEEKLLRTKARLKEQVDKLQSKIEMVDYYLEERLKDQQLENDELVSAV